MTGILDIHVFGPLKKQFDPVASLSEETIVKMPFLINETVKQLLIRLNLSKSNFGECFVNHTIVKNYNDIIPKDARVAVFSQGMLLIDGGLYLKKWKD
ncbi:hypothetical protein CEE45_14450 [Candidatus Heimdallarchaeota archaeon B3_Heim]|nr:MAG: hypothetical protein CEE45_14450 [Candidatus Heimdallarchaeota archaeon B3_Heim]